jgi:hypothetical protein
MTSVIGEAFVAIRADTSKVPGDIERGLARAGQTAGGKAGKGIADGIDGESSTITKSASDAGEKAGKGAGDGLNRGISGGLKTLAAGIGAVFIGAQIKQTIDAGSDLNETLSKNEVVFGKMSGAVEQWGNDAATAFGLSKQQALEAAATFGNLFQSMGIAGLTSAVMSEQIVQLAADLGSFNNVGTDEALESIRSGLVGEAEPLRRFGVNINEAAIQSEALTSGLVQGVAVTEDIAAAQVAAEKAQVAYAKAVQKHGENSVEARDALLKQQEAEAKLGEAIKGQVPNLNAAQKAQAVYQLIVKQTALAQGDFSRTSDGAANQQKILTARFSDLRAEIGLQLLPVFSEMLRIGGEIIQWMRDNEGEAKLLAIAVGTILVAAFVAWAAAAVIAAATTLIALAPVGVAIGIIGLAIADAILLWDRFGPAVSAAVDNYVVPALNTAIGLINDVIDVLNLIPGVDIGHIGEVGGDGGNDFRTQMAGGLGSGSPFTNGPLGRGSPSTTGDPVLDAYLAGVAYGGVDNYRPQTAGGLGKGSPVSTGDPALDRYLAGLRAGGGPVGEGRWLVGERGPEVLTLGAGQRGYVTPNDKLGGVNVHVTTTTPITNTTQFAAELSERIRIANSLVKL